MYRRKPVPQARVAHYSQSQNRWLLSATIVIVALVLGLLFARQAQAASHPKIEVNYPDGYMLEQIGYTSRWVSELSGDAEQAFDKNEPHLARRIWAALAEHNNADAAYKLGMVYDTGAGIERDPARAAYWYYRAAIQGHIHAQHNLAVAYANGDGVDIDIRAALVWWERAAYLGNADSQYNLGIIYAMGVHGIKRDLAMAKKWWRKAALKGDPMAQYNLGTIYANGDGKQIKSYCEAMRWWEKSAENGVQQASWALEFIKTRQDFFACW